MMCTLAPCYDPELRRRREMPRSARVLGLLGLLFVAVVLVGLLSSCASSAKDLHARLHVAWAQSEPIFTELVALENDPQLTKKFGQVQDAADAVHAAFEAYVAVESSENASKLQAALAAATAAADGVIDAFAGDSEDAHRARLYARLLLVLVQTAAAEVPEQPTEAGGASSGAAPGDGTVP